MAKFIVDPNSFNEVHELEFVFDIKAEDLRSKVDKDKNLKLEDGKPIFRVPALVIVPTKDGGKRQDTGVGISVLTPVDLKKGVTYKLDGKVRLTPYIIENGTGENKRASQGLSVIADRIIPVGAGNEQK